MSKQDRQGARTPADLETRYAFAKRFNQSTESTEDLYEQLELLKQTFSDFETNTNKSTEELNAQLKEFKKTFNDYVAATNTTLEALSGAQMIEVEEKGDNIVISDASNQRLRELVLYGKTTQDGEPSRDSPIPLVSVGDGGSIVVTVTDGKNSRTLTAYTPNGLRGIKVESGGNYTDSDGNMWLCDELDYKRGVYIQRIGYIESYVDEWAGDVHLSSTGTIYAGATVIYKLPSPIEKPLFPDEMDDYAELFTYHLDNTISNNTGCYMKVVYVADLKAYIDKKTK